MALPEVFEKSDDKKKKIPTAFTKRARPVPSSQSKKNDDDLDESDISSQVYSNDFECAKYLIKHEGWRALFCHGLGITIIREIPSFAFYFVAYGLLARSSFAVQLGNHAAPLVFGALAGGAVAWCVVVG